jgi:hypothetical protein
MISSSTTDKKNRVMWTRRVAHLGKFSSIVVRMHMELEGKLLNSLKIRIRLVKRLQYVECCRWWHPHLSG